MNQNELLSGLPKFITTRFQSTSNYVWETLFPKHRLDYLLYKYKSKKERREQYRRFRIVSEEAALMVFIFELNRFFLEGSKAAKNAVDTFRELQVEGFYIGKTLFKDRNENVMMGEKIAESLIQEIKNDEMKKLITGSKHYGEILDYYRLIISDLNG